MLPAAAPGAVRSRCGPSRCHFLISGYGRQCQYESGCSCGSSAPPPLPALCRARALRREHGAADPRRARARPVGRASTRASPSTPGLSFGTVVILTGAVVLLAWVPLRQRPGVGTVSNVFVIGDRGRRHAGAAAGRRLGCGRARDAARRGRAERRRLRRVHRRRPRAGPARRADDRLVRRTGGSIRVVRTSIEVAVLAVGAALGGTVGARHRPLRALDRPARARAAAALHDRAAGARRRLAATGPRASVTGVPPQETKDRVEALLEGLNPPQRDAVTAGAGAAADPRRRRLGQDPRADPPDRLPARARGRRAPTRSSRSRSPTRRRRRCASASSCWSAARRARCG